MKTNLFSSRHESTLAKDLKGFKLSEKIIDLTEDSSYIDYLEVREKGYIISLDNDLFIKDIFEIQFNTINEAIKVASAVKRENILKIDMFDYKVFDYMYQRARIICFTDYVMDSINSLDLDEIKEVYSIAETFPDSNMLGSVLDDYMGFKGIEDDDDEYRNIVMSIYN